MTHLEILLNQCNNKQETIAFIMTLDAFDLLDLVLLRPELLQDVETLTALRASNTILKGA